MKTSEIAQILLDSAALVGPPVLQKKLGTDGYSEALRRGWIIPEHESGMIQVSSRYDRREQMRAALEKPAASVAVAESAPKGVPGRQFIGEVNGNVVTLNTVAPAPAKPAPSAPAAPGAPGAPSPQDASIGDMVTVAENGQTFQARVQAKEGDGRLKLTFGSGLKPARDVFHARELKVTGRSPTAVA